MRNQGVGSWPARRARKSPDRIAVVQDGRSWTYRTLYDRAIRLAHAFRDLGVLAGDRISYLGPNDVSFLDTLFAAGLLGAILVPLSTRAAGPELVHNVTDSGSTLLVYPRDHAAMVTQIRASGVIRQFITLGSPLQDGEHRYADLIAGGATDAIDQPTGLDDTCMIMYASGVTGLPRGVVLTHGNVTWNCVNVLVDVDMAGSEITLVAAPLQHGEALNMSCLPTLLKGGTVVLVGAFDPIVVLELIERHRVTSMFGVPAMYEAMAASDAWAGTDLSSLRHLDCGGAPVCAGTTRRYLDRGLAFSQGYRLAEAGQGVLHLAEASPAEQLGFAGVPHLFTSVRVIRPDGREAAPGEHGELVIAGPNVTPGYWRRPDLQDEVFGRDGWLRTGHTAAVNADGYVSVVD
ncbi:AMP-binding protein [Goodfellowiella coeruleoviolacea]|uniref:Fatty-acyl-CoA synthase n=1 Tax=Goodfellowiella coeruleoviolacea TaxID=334858 RepID=A0AAE3GL50_9PSEU|nr:AMP-binding protein [Goodfellowiella coeruleoviolacea]MCP2170267.1 fatty-acyl-CoA synthase [Goodfellowiella coeruleoviolacea]